MEDGKTQLQLAEKIAKDGISVRAAERLIEQAKTASPAKVAAAPAAKDPNVRAAEESLTRRLGTRVHIKDKGKGGRIEIAFTKASELHRIYNLLLSIEN